MDFIAAAQPLIGSEEREAVDRVMRSGMLAQGPEVASFEGEFAAALGVSRPAVAVNSGTSGLHLGLIAAGVGPGDEIIVPSFTFAATANAVALSGATPVFADIDPLTFNITAETVEPHLTAQTRAVLPVHLYGQSADMTGIMELASARGIDVFEDAAQAQGAGWNGSPVGSFGRFAMFSLYPTKNMTSGEGGMVVCDEDVADRVRLLRNQGMRRRYENEVVGFNARMSDLHAAIGRVQLTKVQAWTEERRRTAAFFDAELIGVTTPSAPAHLRHVYHQYTIRVPDDRDGFERALREEFGVGSGVYYPTPCHRLPSLSPFATGPLPETDRAAAEVLSLPVHPALTDADRDRIVRAVNTLAGAGA